MSGGSALMRKPTIEAPLTNCMAPTSGSRSESARIPCGKSLGVLYTAKAPNPLPLSRYTTLPRLGTTVFALPTGDTAIRSFPFRKLFSEASRAGSAGFQPARGRSPRMDASRPKRDFVPQPARCQRSQRDRGLTPIIVDRGQRHACKGKPLGMTQLSRNPNRGVSHRARLALATPVATAPLEPGDFLE